MHADLTAHTHPPHPTPHPHPATIIRTGVNPFARNTVIICHDNALATRVNGAIVPVFWWNNDYWPLSGVVALNLLDRDARSCTREISLGPAPGCCC